MIAYSVKSMKEQKQNNTCETDINQISILPQGGQHNLGSLSFGTQKPQKCTVHLAYIHYLGKVMKHFI